MHAATLHSHIAAVVDREARGLTEILLEHVLLIVAVNADDLHALVDGVEHKLGSMTLAHRAYQFGMVIVQVKVLRCLPAHQPGRLDAGSNIA